MPEARRSELHFEEEHQLSTMRPSCIKREAQLTLFEKLNGERAACAARFRYDAGFCGHVRAV
jgi:hypothetical protein